MAISRRFDPQVPKAVAVGTPVTTEGVQQATVHTSGTFTATIDLEGSNDGTDWVVLQAGLTTGTIVAISPLPVRFMRINTTAYTVGTPVVKILGVEQ